MTSVVVEQGGQRRTVNAKAVVLTSGGFEANLDWLRRYWGDAVENYVIRGTPYNDGRVLAAMLARGAATAGRPEAAFTRRRWTRARPNSMAGLRPG